MQQHGDFFDEDQGKIFTKIHSGVDHRKPVIKRDQLVLGRPRKIEHALHVSETHQDGKVTPIYNDDALIGIIYECSCGKVAQILFDFEEQSQNEHGQTAATG
ncbi:hypothetical protein DRI50_01970 [candidate division KSB1 bacterium]|jgi:hypothetical protein|nr:MAG: hypothetical protein DRI50_01970 [candidate division KSB1 bacterium]